MLYSGQGSRVLDGPQSVVLRQAEDCLHVHKALFEKLLGGPVEVGWPSVAAETTWNS